MAKHPASNEFADIPVVIFCGGRGTRLKEETEIIPKPLVCIGERPIVWHIMKIYYAQGFRRFVLLLGYKGEKIKEYFHNYFWHASDFSLRNYKRSNQIIYHHAPNEEWEVTCIDTGLETQTGARLKKLEGFLKDKTFMLTYGDGVANVDLRPLLSEHKKGKHVVTVTAVSPPGRFGEITLQDGKVTSFFEKPERSDFLINGGYFVVDRKIFQRLADHEALNFENDVLPILAKNGELGAVAHRGYWQCMDTVRDMELLNAQWAKGDAPWKSW